MVEKTFQPDEESSTIMEGVKNTPPLFVEGKSMVQESSQSNMNVQEEIFYIDENKATSNGTNLTITFTSLRFCKENINIRSR